MPIFSQGLTRNKLLLLYLLQSTPYTLTERQLYTVLFDTDSMSYFDFCEAVAQLREDGYVSTDDGLSGMTYRLTADGTETLALFVESVPLSLREKVSAYEEQNRDALRSASQYLSRMQETADGGYAVQLLAVENERILFCLELSAATRDHATRMRRNWSGACPGLYQTVLEKLLIEKE